ncbi:TonB-dependent receptor [Flavobacterium tegetincola]|uniref:TonB-dependent receptor n=1 Tax=Flavobacterium tegetincola TaxID=150172 RepID=UPI000405EB89|nr:TonB-dependent receptor [Flavobacterium tegetincola]
MIKKIKVWAFLIGMPFFSMGQEFKISGTITDSLGVSINSTIITVTKTQDAADDILAYTNSNASGDYNLIIKESGLDSIFLNVRHMAYSSFHIKIALQNGIKNVILYPRVEQLKEVLIESQKIVKVRGDTITYNVAGLKAQKDYTIEEVISRIPGITIKDNGQIQYKEKAISHLYINGVDLLEGRYSIATRGIPADAVKDIDVLTRHNHERIDIGRTESDKVSLNLKIKENQSVVFGSSKNEAGTPLITGLMETTPIYLKNNFQNISSVKFNNIGETVIDNASSLTVDDYNLFRLKMNETSVIQPTNVNGTMLSNKYWLDNESYAVTNDALHKINDSTLVKWNVNYANELSKINKSTTNTYILENDSTVVTNINRNSLRSQRFEIGVNQEINKRNFYLKNKTNFQYSDDKGIEYSILNQNPIQANYLNFETKFNNSTLLKSVFGKNNILQSGILLEYEKQFEELKVTPPVYEQFLGNDDSSIATQQNVELSKFNIGGFSEYTFNWLRLKWNLNQTLQYNYFKFKSQLNQVPSPSLDNFPFFSDLNFQKLTSLSTISSKLTLGKMQITWRLSANYSSVHTKERDAENAVSDDSFLFLQPMIVAKYKFNRKWDSGVSYTCTKSISDFNQLYQAVILKSYNSLVQNPPIINQTTDESITPFVSYSDIINSFYFTFKGSINKTQSDVTFSYQLNNAGFTIINVLNQSNTIENKNVSLNLSKGILGSINAKLSYTVNFTDSDMYFNNDFIKAINRSHRIDLGFTWDNGSWYSLEYKADYNFSSTVIEKDKITNPFLFHTANLDFYTSSSTRLHLGAESTQASISTSKKNRNTIFNMSFFYKPSKKLFLKAGVANVFNTSTFATTYSSGNGINLTQFELRPRQITVGLTYSL